MGDTVQDLDIKIEQKDSKIDFSESKERLPDSKVIEEMNKLRLNKISSKIKGDWIMDKLNNSLNNHEYINNKKIKQKFLNKSLALIMSCL